MLNRIFQVLLVAGLVAGTARAANDPFVGRWKVNPSKSKLTDTMKVEAVGANKYAITFAPGAVDTIVADGSDQPALQGTTFSIAVEGPNNWTVIRKKNGRTLIMAKWTLSADGKTLTDAYTEYGDNGQTLSVNYAYQRTAGSSGFAGTWESTSEEVKSDIELQVQAYEGDGLSFNSAAMGIDQKIKFDGKEHPEMSRNMDPGSTFSGRRVNERTLEITEKFQGKITNNRQIELSKDLKTLTIGIRVPGESKPKNILVFERE